MAQRPADMDMQQLRKDFFQTKNQYALDDRFVIRDGKKHPVAIVVPGGAYAMVCSFIEGAPVARKLNEKGISAYIVYYRVKKKAHFPAPQDDLATAVREVLSKAEQDNLITDNYSIWGSSAGGHLAASFGTQHMGYPVYNLPAPGALVLSYPVITLRRALTHMGTHDNLLGKNATLEEEISASIDENVTADYPPTYIWCGDADAAVPPANTRRMVRALAAAGVRHECEIFPGVDHGVGPATGLAAEGWIDHAVEFWLGEEQNEEEAEA